MRQSQQPWEKVRELQGAAEGREGLFDFLDRKKAFARTLIQADQFSWAQKELLLVCKAGVNRQECFQIFFKEL